MTHYHAQMSDPRRQSFHFSAEITALRASTALLAWKRTALSFPCTVASLGQCVDMIKDVDGQAVSN
jgi:uncharacterized membrane protein YidH (DUF202 family)